MWTQAGRGGKWDTADQQGMQSSQYISSLPIVNVLQAGIW